MKNIVFTGGGTAGHVMPNVALMQELSSKFNCFYIGTDGMEQKIITENFGDDCFKNIKAPKLQRKLTLKNLALPFRLMASVRQCKKLLKEIKPSLVFAKGGYVSFPVVYAAKKLNIPVFIHESDYSLGLANKIAKRYCTKIFTTFADTAENCKKAEYSGSPIRQSIYAADKKLGLETMGFDGKRKIITVVGGSLGAKRLNEIVFAALDDLLKDFDVFLIAGKGKKLNIKANGFAQTEFVNNVFDVFAASDLIISRAGSNTICEIAAMRRPMLLVPLAQATRGEQGQNAKYFFQRGCCISAEEDTLTTETFCRKIRHSIDNADYMKQNQKRLKIDGTKMIIKEIEQITGVNKS